MKTKTIYNLVKLFSFLGILLAVYLLWQQFFRPEWQPCTINSFINCDAIISGGVAKTFGISTPLIGLIGYIVIFLSSIFRWKKIMLAMAVFGLVFCLWIAYQELFLLKVICPVCIGCQTIMIVVNVLAFMINRGNVSR